jgi:hypothetical protein
MKKEHLNLWQNIATFKLDDPQAARPFSKKLAEEQKWTEDFTQRVIAEYKKFAFLCVTLPNGASPSPTVDEAWHLHLTYTDSYWNQFCPNVLGTQLHHHPSKGGSGETQKHEDWYRQTLSGYVEIFEQLPPNDIWTMPLNFDPSEYLPKNSPFLMQKNENTTATAWHENVLSTDENNVSQRKTSVWEYLAYALVINLGVAVLIPTLLKGAAFLLPFSLLSTLIAVLIAQHHAQHKDLVESKIQENPLTVSPYIAAWIAGGNERLLTTFLYEVTEKCTFQPTTNSMVFQLKKSENLYKNPLYTALETVEKPEISLNFIKETVKPYAQLIENQVDSRDYEAETLPSKLWTLIGLFGFIGFARLCEGLFFHKPVLFLLLTIIIAVLILAITHSATAFNFQSWRERFTSHYQNQYAVQNGDNIMWQFALGTAAFSMGTNWYGFENSIRPQEHNKHYGGDGGSSSGCSGGGDGGGSCGGSSCGGGCGGCGGGCGG